MEKDRKLLDTIVHAHEESIEIYKILLESINLYSTAEKLMYDGNDKFYFNSMKLDVIHEEMLFKTRKEFEEQVSQIVSRLDSIR